MSNTPAISSEDELLGLRNEGKISEAEYQDLLGAVRKTPSSGSDAPGPQNDEAGSKRRLGKIALILMIVGIVVPGVCYLMVELASGPNADAAIGPWFFLGVALEIAAFVTGMMARPDDYGRAVVTTVSALGALCTLLFLFLA